MTDRALGPLPDDELGVLRAIARSFERIALSLEVIAMKVWTEDQVHKQREEAGSGGTQTETTEAAAEGGAERRRSRS